MAYIFFNPNPHKLQTGDCTVRALCIALDAGWNEAYCELCAMGLSICDMPSSNNTWGELLVSKGFRYSTIPNTCPFCYTVSDFCRDNPRGVFILGTGTHVIAVKNGDYYDAWDSGDKVPIYYFSKEE